MQIRLSADRYVQGAFVLAIAVLVLVGGLSYRSLSVSEESDRWVDHTNQVSAGLDNMLYSMSSVEAKLRSFILTGDEGYMDALGSSVAMLRQNAAAVRGLTVDNAGQQSRLLVADELIAELTVFCKQVTALRRAEEMVAAAASLQEGDIQRITLKFLDAVRAMKTEETKLLRFRTDDSNARLAQTKSILILGTVLGLVITGAAGFGVLRDSRRRRLAEEALRASQDQYRALLDGVYDHAILMLNPRGQVVTWNVGAERITGYPAEQVIGSHFARFFPKEDIERGRPEEILALAAVHGRQEEHGRRVRSDGTQFVASSSYTALYDPAGKLRGFSEITRDLSESKESGAKYRGLLEAAPDAMVVVNPAGDIVLLNLQAEKQFGYHRDELLGQGVSVIIPLGFAERLVADGLRSAEDALAQQIGTGIELTARRKDGSEFPIEIMLSPLRSSDGVLVTAAIRDISARKAAEAHLVQMESRYRGLLEAAPDAMVVVNTAGDIVLLNVQAEKQFGYRRDELLGQPLTNIIPEGFAERLVADGLRSAEDARAQQIGTGIELTAQRKDGSRFPIELMLSPLESDGGILVTAAIRDISARRSADAELQMKVAQLNLSNEELQQFAYVASHDLQEPLRMVASYVALIARRYKGRLDSDADDFIAFAVDGAKRMQALIQDLLAYSRVGSKGGELVATSSEDALRQAIRNLQAAIDESAALVTHDPLPNVMADEMQLTQLFQNLLGNAIKYRRADAPGVHVNAVLMDGGRWMFSVQDNGLGIEPQYFERIFGMFQRLHGREEFAGTGIGLAICKKIVERHGGGISVESTVGRGSTFSFPLAASDKS